MNQTAQAAARNTPAYAGKTVLHVVSLHLCPETPPLTRGRPGGCCIGRLQTRNTPAYAGKTILHHFLQVVVQKHPRLRGEDRKEINDQRARLETPPLTRGRPIDAVGASVILRNTPAYAGKTPRNSIKAEEYLNHLC